MKDNKRNWLSLKEYELCYPLEYLEFLSVFEENGQKRVLLDDEAIRLIDVLLKKTDELKTEKINNFLKSSVALKQTQETDPIKTGKMFKSTNRFFEKVATGNVGKKESEEPSDPKHEKIFCNNGFVLFDHILNEYVKTDRGRLSDIHFFYRSMYENDPQYIHQRPERFKEWFFENYNSEDLGKIKTLSQVDNPQRKKDYSNALDWFKHQK